MTTVPDNLITLASHGSADVPAFITQNIKLDEVQLEHFSDHATWNLLDYIPEDQKIRPRFGRIVGDPNRAPDAKDIFRTEDFQGNEIWHEPLTKETKEWLLSLSYEPYHAAIKEKIENASIGPDESLLIVDVHDYPSRYAELPMVIISNYDGQAASQEVMDDLQQAFIQRFNLSPAEVKQNDHYKGGFVTQYYGDAENFDLSAAQHDRNVVQIEINRLFYMDPNTEEIDEGALGDFAEKLTQILSEVAEANRHAPAHIPAFSQEREPSLVLQ